MRDHNLAAALRIDVREVKTYPEHYLKEIYTKKRAEFEARMEIAGELKIMPHQVILPEF